MPKLIQCELSAHFSLTFDFTPPLIADAALYAECGEECGDYAHDKLEHGLESFFV